MSKLLRKPCFFVPFLCPVANKTIDILNASVMLRETSKYTYEDRIWAFQLLMKYKDKDQIANGSLLMFSKLTIDYPAEVTEDERTWGEKYYKEETFKNEFNLENRRLRGNFKEPYTFEEYLEIHTKIKANPNKKYNYNYRYVIELKERFPDKYDKFNKNLDGILDRFISEYDRDLDRKYKSYRDRNKNRFEQELFNECKRRTKNRFEQELFNECKRRTKKQFQKELINECRRRKIIIC